MPLGSDTVVYDRAEKRVASRRTKGIVPNFPVHTILLAEEGVNAQFFEWEYATESKQIFEAGCKEHIRVKIEAAEAIDC